MQEWKGTLFDPRPEEVAALFAWNQPAGPVPAAHRLSYITVGWQYSGNSEQPHCNIYVRLRDTRVRLAALHGWFPHVYWEHIADSRACSDLPCDWQCVVVHRAKRHRGSPSLDNAPQAADDDAIEPPARG